MKRNKEKITISISLDNKLNSYIEELITNKSGYIEWLIYQDLLEKEEDVKKIII